MKKRDFIDLIMAVESVMAIEDAVEILTGRSLEGPKVTDIYLLWEILRRNSVSKFHTAQDFDIDTEQYESFISILENKELSADEKYLLLTNGGECCM